MPNDFPWPFANRPCDWLVLDINPLFQLLFSDPLQIVSPLPLPGQSGLRLPQKWFYREIVLVFSVIKDTFLHVDVWILEKIPIEYWMIILDIFNCQTNKKYLNLI